MTVQKFDHKSAKVLVTGTSGTGKTTLFEKMLRSEKARIKFVFDHQGEFALRFQLPAVVDMEGLYKAASIGGFVVFDPIKLCDWEDADGERVGLEGAFNIFCETIFEMSKVIKGRKIFACDELQKLTGTREVPVEFTTIMDTGRRYQLDVFLISQAPNRIHNAIRNQLTKVFTFRQSDANAITYLEANGFDAEKVRNLPRGKFLWRDLDSGEVGGGGQAI